MIELYLSKVTESSETETAGKLYARVSYKQTMDLHDMAHHTTQHPSIRNTILLFIYLLL